MPLLTAGRAAGLQHLDAAGHRARRGRRPARGLHRPALLLAGGQDAAAGDRRRRADLRRGAGQGHRRRACRSARPPIVVNDSRGFFTSRVIGTFVAEAAAMVGEGVPANSVEQAALQAGYPVGPLALTDEVSLTLGLKIKKAGRGGGRRPRACGLRGRTRATRSSRRWSPSTSAAAAPPAPASTTTPRASSSACGAGLKELLRRRQPRHPVEGPAGADAVHRGDREHQVPRRERPAHRAGRQHRLDLRHRLPGLDRRRAAVRQHLRRRGPCRPSSRGPTSWPPTYGERFTPPASVVALAEAGGSYK